MQYLQADVPGPLHDIACVYWESEEKQALCRVQSEEEEEDDDAGMY